MIIPALPEPYEQLVQVVAVICDWSLSRRLLKDDAKPVDEGDGDDEEESSGACVFSSSPAASARRLDEEDEFPAVAAETVFVEVGEKMVNGTMTLSSCSACSSGLELPIAVTAASVCRSVDSGGSAAATARRRNADVRNAASTIVTRRALLGTGNVDEFVSSMDSESVCDSVPLDVSDVVPLPVIESVCDSLGLSVRVKVSVLVRDSVRVLD